MLHRHDLQVVLYERAVELGVDVQLGKSVVSINLDQASPVIHFPDGVTLAADIIIGADGKLHLRDYGMAAQDSSLTNVMGERRELEGAQMHVSGP